jgi:uncharacterized protein GlcG (DUF336 family)
MSDDHARFLPRRTVNLATARAVAAAAEDKAEALGLRMAIAILDDGGHLLHFIRMDGVHIGTIDMAIGKARSAIAFRRPTKAFGDMVAGGTVGLLAVPGLIPFEGGIPLMADGLLAGAIGVSGGRPEEDGTVAAAGAIWLEAE